MNIIAMTSAFDDPRIYSVVDSHGLLLVVHRLSGASTYAGRKHDLSNSKAAAFTFVFEHSPTSFAYGRGYNCIQKIKYNLIIKT